MLGQQKEKIKIKLFIFSYIFWEGVGENQNFVNYFSYIYCEDGGGGTGETAHERLHGLVQDPEENTR